MTIVIIARIYCYYSSNVLVACASCRSQIPSGSIILFPESEACLGQKQAG